MPTRFDSHRLTATGQETVDAIKAKAEELAQLIDQVAEAGLPHVPAYNSRRSTAIALTHLQTSVMFAVRAASEAFHD